ncbi:nuclease-related domain-containing protein [Virgibacillus halophilus]|uniref:Nuclease-related domain-containing protein n=1 Tax=Tigheibacillus halophilus TaxID=361280 RepID=A0ABU5C6K8_9BACI|nr:nuclease-related domain-containing protein [Virgibacillus halophilus]
MLVKKRTKSKELFILELLNKRMNLERKEKQRYFNLKKGFEGEMRFDDFIEKLQCECLILHDLLLEVNHTMFQIDSLLIMQKQLYIYEIKKLSW